jgi:hypothetical protein
MNRQIGQTLSTNEVPLSAETKKLTYEAALAKSIEEVFSSLSEQVKETIYRSFQSQYAMPEDQIPNRIDTFAFALENVFGETAKLVELKILENLQHKVQRFKYKPKNHNVLFIEWLAAFRKYMNSQMIFLEA